jgi:hypothetical protein
MGSLRLASPVDLATFLRIKAKSSDASELTPAVRQKEAEEAFAELDLPVLVQHGQGELVVLCAKSVAVKAFKAMRGMQARLGIMVPEQLKGAVSAVKGEDLSSLVDLAVQHQLRLAGWHPLGNGSLIKVPFLELGAQPGVYHSAPRMVAVQASMDLQAGSVLLAAQGAGRVKFSPFACASMQPGKGGQPVMAPQEAVQDAAMLRRFNREVYGQPCVLLPHMM